MHYIGCKKKYSIRATSALLTSYLLTEQCDAVEQYQQINHKWYNLLFSRALIV